MFHSISLTIESGTYEINAMIKLVIIDNWRVLRHHGTDPELVANARARRVGLIYPCDPNWRCNVIVKSEAMYGDALPSLEH